MNDMGANFYYNAMARSNECRLDNGTGCGGNTRPQVGALFCDGASDGRALHFALYVDNNASVI